MGLGPRPVWAWDLGAIQLGLGPGPVWARDLGAVQLSFPFFNPEIPNKKDEKGKLFQLQLISFANPLSFKMHFSLSLSLFIFFSLSFLAWVYFKVIGVYISRLLYWHCLFLFAW